MVGNRKRVLTLMAVGLGAFVTTGNANAAAINLVCEEAKGISTKITTRLSTLSGKKEDKEETALYELWKIPVMVDTPSGKGTVWGKIRALVVEPETLELNSWEEERDGLLKVTSGSSVKINRKSLRFTYSSFRLSTSSEVSALFQNGRKSEGICRKVTAAKGNQI